MPLGLQFQILILFGMSNGSITTLAKLIGRSFSGLSRATVPAIVSVWRIMSVPIKRVPGSVKLWPPMRPNVVPFQLKWHKEV